MQTHENGQVHQEISHHVEKLQDGERDFRSTNALTVSNHALVVYLYSGHPLRDEFIAISQLRRPNLKKRNMQPKATSEHHAGTVDALYDYLTDCRFTEKQVNTGIPLLALEYVYRPHPRFWRDFDIAYLVDAVTRHLPDWQNAANRGTERSSATMLKEVADTLKLYAFDEANAEMIQSLPAQERPADRHSAFEWISSELTKRGLTAEREYAMRDGRRCGEGALQVVRCLEAAAADRTVDRMGTSVDHAYSHPTRGGRRPLQSLRGRLHKTTG